MPQAQDIIVNNGDTPPVAKTFTLINPAAGDGGVAMWALKEGLISAVFPSFSAVASKTANKSRKLTLKLRVPSSYTDSVTGLTAVGSAAEANVTMSIPDDFPELRKDDVTAFLANIISDPLVMEMLHDAYPAT